MENINRLLYYIKKANMENKCGAVRVVPPPDYKPINNIDDLEKNLLTQKDESKNLFE